MTTLWNILKISEMIQDDLIWFQKDSGSFTNQQSSIKKVPIWRLGDVQKTPPRSHMNPQNHPQIDKSLVLAHNIHKEVFYEYCTLYLIIFLFLNIHFEERRWHRPQTASNRQHVSEYWATSQNVVLGVQNVGWSAQNAGPGLGKAGLSAQNAGL